MSNFWPAGFELSDTESPMQILKSAQEEWATQSDGALVLLLKHCKSQMGNDMIVVDAKHVPSNRTTTLFEVVHRPATPYPVTIQPKGMDLPDFLKKSYHQQGIDSIVAASVVASYRMTGHDVTNEWVADTPSEFRTKLTQVFNLGTTKSEILNLVSAGLPVAKPSEGQAKEDEAEDK